MLALELWLSILVAAVRLMFSNLFLVCVFNCISWHFGEKLALRVSSGLRQQIMATQSGRVEPEAERTRAALRLAFANALPSPAT